MFKRAKHSIHLPDSIVNFKVQSLKDKIKQNIRISRNVLPRFSSDEFINTLSHSLHRPKARETNAAVVLHAKEEAGAVPCVIRLRKSGDVVSHRGSAVVHLRSVEAIVLDVDVLTEEVKPRAGSCAVGAPAEAVADRLETFFCKVARDAEGVEEFEGLGEGVSTGEVEGSESLCCWLR